MTKRCEAVNPGHEPHTELELSLLGAFSILNQPINRIAAFGGKLAEQ
jgi:hypothetical protein